MAPKTRSGKSTNSSTLTRIVDTNETTPDPWFLTAIETLNDLTNYIGLGVVTLPLSDMVGPGPEAPDGWHWLELPVKKPRRIEGVAYDLYMLAALHLVRCTYKMLAVRETSNQPAFRAANAIVRVYCLPDDVGKGLASRKNRNIRKYMRNVMKEVDVSSELWEGKVPLGGLGEKASLLSKASELAPTQGLDTRLTTIAAPSGEVYYLDLKTCEVFEQPSYDGDIRGGELKGLEEMDIIVGAKRAVTIDGDVEMEDPPKRTKIVESG